MKNNTRLRFYFKILAFTVLFFLACGFQTSFWPNIITFIPSPQIWLILIIYMIIRWPPTFTIFYIYFLGFCLIQFSVVPLKMIWLTFLLLFCLLSFIKNRIQLSGAFAFILLALLGSTAFEVSYYLFSDFLETTPTSIMFVTRSLQILVNFIFCYPLYFILHKFDTMLFDENDWAKSTKPTSSELIHE